MECGAYCYSLPVVLFLFVHNGLPPRGLFWFLVLASEQACPPFPEEGWSFPHCVMFQVIGAQLALVVVDQPLPQTRAAQGEACVGLAAFAQNETLTIRGLLSACQ